MHLDWCKVSFVGKLDDGTVVDQATDMELHLGDNEVVQGLDMALALMNQGEKAEVKVNARFAYGELGLVSAEPDNAVIVPPNVTVCKRITVICLCLYLLSNRHVCALSYSSFSLRLLLLYFLPPSINFECRSRMR